MSCGSLGKNPSPVPEDDLSKLKETNQAPEDDLSKLKETNKAPEDDLSKLKETNKNHHEKNIALHNKEFQNHSPQVTNIEEKPKKKKRKGTKRKPRCAFCDKKLKMSQTVQCRCENHFCGKHKDPFEHKCPINYKDLASKQLQKNKIDVRFDKLSDRI